MRIALRTIVKHAHLGDTLFQECDGERAILHADPHQLRWITTNVPELNTMLYKKLVNLVKGRG